MIYGHGDDAFRYGEKIKMNFSSNVYSGADLSALKEHLMEHHLYVCAADCPELKRHLTFRDYLRAHPEAVEEYSRVKQEGAALYPHDIDSYIGHKSPFIEKIYKEAGLV